MPTALCKPLFLSESRLSAVPEKSGRSAAKKDAALSGKRRKFMESEKLERLSQLTAIARKRELTAAEKQERESLRSEYRAAVTGSLRAQLNSTVIVNPDGTSEKVSERVKKSGKETSGEV
jgi:uncharacterized protein YnzC (UPF0291/DUF896 family)